MRPIEELPIGGQIERRGRNRRGEEKQTDSD
jgi:hypothetical protein